MLSLLAVITGNYDGGAWFSTDGKKMEPRSNRNQPGTHDTNIFIANRVQ